jgi:1-acyl-sn-glycerol-3-phosphate acyltransferase
VENLPSSPPAIVAMNHAGMCFPWDFVCLGVLLSEKTGWFVQPLAHPIFFDHPWLVWWLPRGWAQVLGGVRAERESFETAIAHKTVLLYAPEGWRGLAKGWNHRYQLATFDPSFVRLSARYQVPIAPTVCMGNEFLHPWTTNSKALARWLKMPLLPVSPLLLLFVLFPSLGVWAMRTQLKYYFQPLPPVTEPESTRSQLYDQAANLRSQLQQEIDQHVQKSSDRQDPYKD